MLDFFTDPYEDEILYSTIARHHYYSGNVSMRETLIQVFGDRNALPSIAVPCRIAYFTSQLENEIYTPDYWIRKHTILPYYLSFMDKGRKQRVMDAVNGNGGKGLFTLIGMAAGGICRKLGLYYCPQCASEDMKRYGEAYFHRLHQLEGVIVCDRHGCILKEYPVEKEKLSRIQFIRFDFKSVELDELAGSLDDQYQREDDTYLSLKLCDVAKAAKYIIDRDFSEFDNVKVHENITAWLATKGYLTRKGYVRQRNFCHDLHTFYGDKFLDLMECSFEPGVDYSWPCEAVRQPGKAIHPVRYILISLFLCGSAEGLFLPPQKCEKTPKSVSNSQLEDGNDKCSFDINWEKRLVEVIKNGGSLRGIAREMGCDPKTVLKHAYSLGIAHLVNSRMKVKVPKGKPVEPDYSVDADEMRKFIQDNPGYTRNEVRKIFYRQYMRLYKYQHELLYSILPKKVTQLPGGTQKVDWVARDVEILEKARMSHARLLLMPEPVRISNSRLVKEIGCPSLRFYLDKLPMTKEFIENVIESIEDFQIRRVDFVCQKLYEEKGCFEKWEVMRIAGLKHTTSYKVSIQIDENIEKFCGGRLTEERPQYYYQRFATPQ